MSTLTPGETHYMSVYHGTAGVARSSWTMTLFKNGQQVRDINIDVKENPSTYYTFSFANDGEHMSEWTLIAHNVDGTYTRNWRVEKPLVQGAVQTIRQNLSSSVGLGTR